ncbi:MAG: ACP S-malonyltransferase [Flavobacteriia bacterium]|nr:ACP S-malonyltransferase [Flavobacteriia bacterium]
MKAYIFPGQGAQFSGMGKDLYEKSPEAKFLFQRSNEVLGFDIQSLMFEGSDEELKQTKVTQPAIFVHSCILAKVLGDEFKPNMVAGHSLGEFSALVSTQSISFEDGLNLVYQRAMAMQMACEKVSSTMAAILGLDDETVENICASITDGIVVPANYNCPGQLVISGDVSAVEKACKLLSEAGAKRAIILQVGGAFHSPLMEPAREKLANAIQTTIFRNPICPIYQNVNAKAVIDSEQIKENLIKQLTAPVRWTQTMHEMLKDGAAEVIEVGPGTVLQGLFKKVDRSLNCSSAILV